MYDDRFSSNNLTRLFKAITSGSVSNERIINMLIEKHPEIYAEIVLEATQPPSLDTRKYFEIAKNAYDGRKIDAIKLLRAATGFGLKESKDIIDNFLNMTGISSIAVNKLDEKCYAVYQELQQAWFSYNEEPF